MEKPVNIFTKPALIFGGLYVLGVFVISLHLSRFSIYDLDLTKVRYIFAGGMCAFFILLRLVITALFIDWKIVNSTLSSAHDEIYDELKKLWFFDITIALSKLPILNRILAPVSPGRLARNIVSGIILLAFLVLLGSFSLFLEVDELHLQPSLSWLNSFPFFLQGLVFGQIAYIVFFYFKRSLQKSILLKWLWTATILMIVISDISFYALCLHPLVRPAFGGGVAVKVRMIENTKESNNFLKKTDVLNFKDGVSQDMYLLHSSDSTYYLTKSIDYSYESPTFPQMIDAHDIFALPVKMFSGFELKGFK